jgi:hypothetical protein
MYRLLGAGNLYGIPTIHTMRRTDNMRIGILPALAGALAVCLAAATSRVEARDTITITVTVRDNNGVPLQGINVQFDGDTISGNDVTNNLGQVTISGAVGPPLSKLWIMVNDPCHGNYNPAWSGDCDVVSGTQSGSYTYDLTPIP